MKHMIWVVGLALALGATPAAAQTRVSVAVGFGVPRPFVHGMVVVGRPLAYYPPATGRVIVIAPTRAACETIELAMGLEIDTLLAREHGDDIRRLAASGRGFGIVAGTGTGKTLAIRPIAATVLGAPLKVGVVNREREATPETPTWNVVIVTTGIARRWFEDGLITARDTLVVDEIHQTSAELELCLALGKRAGCRFVWLSATVDPSFYARYLGSVEVLETRAFDPAKAARVRVLAEQPLEFLNDRFIKTVMRERRGVAVFVPTRAEVEQIAKELGSRWQGLPTAFRSEERRVGKENRSRGRP